MEVSNNKTPQNQPTVRGYASVCVFRLCFSVEWDAAATELLERWCSGAPVGALTARLPELHRPTPSLWDHPRVRPRISSRAVSLGTRGATSQPCNPAILDFWSLMNGCVDPRHRDAEAA